MTPSALTRNHPTASPPRPGAPPAGPRARTPARRPAVAPPRHRAVALLEACVAIMLIAIVLALVSVLVTHYADASDYFLNHRRAQLAAEANVERLRAGLIPIADAAFTDEAGIAIEIHIPHPPHTPPRNQTHPPPTPGVEPTHPSGPPPTIAPTDPGDAWAPLQRVRVTAAVRGKHGRVARFELATYLAPDPPGTREPPETTPP